jgi:glycerol-3-phosphate dehydrogenase subunit B
LTGRRTIAEVERIADVRVIEALGIAPSLPGLRLARALNSACTSAGVAHQAGRVMGGVTGRDRLDAVNVATATGYTSIVARAWVLATGRFIGGGIAADPMWRETALGVPLEVERLGARSDRLEPLVHSDADRIADQAWLGVGVHCDADQRPLLASPDMAAEPIHANLFAAGAVLAGALPGHGEAARSGWAAGTRAAMWAAQ